LIETKFINYKCLHMMEDVNLGKQREKNLSWIQKVREREFFIDNLLVRIHLIIVMIRRTGLAP